MAENETLDLLHRNSGRWRKWFSMIKKGAPPNRVADEGVRCLIKTSQNLLDLQFPWRGFLDAAKCQDRETLRELVRHCEKGREYAELLGQRAAIYGQGEPLVASVVRGAADKFLDQIGHNVVGNGSLVDFAQFRDLRIQIKKLMEPGITRLAHQIATDPTAKPRMLGRTRKQKDQAHSELLELSLHQTPSGTHG